MNSVIYKVNDVSFVDDKVHLQISKNDKVIEKIIPLEVYLLDPIIRGSTLSNNEYAKIEERCVENEAYEYAIKLLSKQEYSSYSLVNKLEKKYSSKTIKKVIRKLEDMHFIDDKAYIIDYIETKQRKAIAVDKLVYELKDIGYTDIDESILDRYKVKDYEYASMFVDKYLKLYHRLEKEKVIIRLYRQLLTRGYSEELIRSVFSEKEIDI